ncbi:MAG: hypothetical protein QOI32_1559, partial [Thermoleophilaceae bacterium]|nr:hypothetical protein [Thermoleophilaceae bacterium]
MRTVGVALLGHGFMGLAHSRAYRALSSIEERPAAVPRLFSISGRDRNALESARSQWGWERAACDWRTQLEDQRVALFDNTGPNALHLEPTLAAIRAGKHVLCE